MHNDMKGNYMKKREWINFLKGFGAEVSKQGKDTVLLVFRFEQSSRNQDEITANMRAGRAKVEAIEAQILKTGNSEIIEQVGDVYKQMVYITYKE